MTPEDPAREARETLKRASEGINAADAVLAEAEQVKVAQRVGYLARKLGYHPRTVRRWCESGQIAATLMPSGRWRIEQSEVDRLTHK